MSKRHSAKYKIDRRMGENIWGRPKSPINQRQYGPGQHGQRDAACGFDDREVEPQAVFRERLLILDDAVSAT